MNSGLVPVPSRRDIVRAGFENLPSAILRAGDRATWRFIEFFTANIRNKNTRAAYAQAVRQFFSWTERRGIRELVQVRPVLISLYIEELGVTRSIPGDVRRKHMAIVGKSGVGKTTLMRNQ